ncbi:MAG: sigma-54-dependent Fis family transcriptional regulator [Deltaproteobacteria bacterium]|nr:sigma-54-dependent Fis family transcriptional regulator [Deltaproteobacteria bacterium]MBI3386952.1 sigma-54-dependent Fis family transcriptional regulator [Deltaproteobacteria bacterium]
MHSRCERWPPGRGVATTAVDAMKNGALNYDLRPFDEPAIGGVMRNVIELRRDQTENRFLKQPSVATPAFENLIGASPAMQLIYEMIRQVSPAKGAVLITGETGTGKELVARAIHNLGPRRDKLFVPLNCAAIPPDLLESELFGHVRGAFTGAQAERIGKFEMADGGTLFLDEIGDLAYPLQAKLLRVLQEGVLERVGSNKPIGVDVRVVSSTNRDLASSMRDARFREDLYYRLNVFHIDLPPLRERCDDIGHLAAFFLARAGAELGKGALTLRADAAPLLLGHAWPGNVRELRNVMQRAAVLSPASEIDLTLLRMLLPHVRAEAVADLAADGLRLDAAVEEVERKVIVRALAVANDKKAEAARLLGISERTLWYKLKRYGL